MLLSKRGGDENQVLIGWTRKIFLSLRIHSRLFCRLLRSRAPSKFEIKDLKVASIMSRSHYAGIKSSNFLGHRGNFQTGMLVPNLLVTQLTGMMQEHFLKSNHSACARGIIFFYMSRFNLFALATDRFVYLSHRRSWTIVLGHFRICGAFFNTHMPNPFLHPKNNVGHVSPHFFSEFQHCEGWEEGYLQ